MEIQLLQYCGITYKYTTSFSHLLKSITANTQILQFLIFQIIILLFVLYVPLLSEELTGISDATTTHHTTTSILEQDDSDGGGGTTQNVSQKRKGKGKGKGKGDDVAAAVDVDNQKKKKQKVLHARYLRVSEEGLHYSVVINLNGSLGFDLRDNFPESYQNTFVPIIATIASTGAAVGCGKGVVPGGICLGDHITSISGQSVINTNMNYVVKLVKASQRPLHITLWRSKIMADAINFSISSKEKLARDVEVARLKAVEDARVTNLVEAKKEKETKEKLAREKAATNFVEAKKEKEAKEKLAREKAAAEEEPNNKAAAEEEAKKKSSKKGS